MNNPSTNPAEIKKALAELKRRIVSSKNEFFDDLWNVASAFNVQYEALADAYDASDRA